MDDSKRTDLWNERFEAAVRHRYFLKVKDKLANRLRRISIAIGLLSCGPIAAFLAQNGWGPILALAGIAAGVLGIYLSTSGLSKGLAIATQAATLWGHHAGDLARLWSRAQAGEDVWQEFQTCGAKMNWVDAVATDALVAEPEVVESAWQEARAVLS